TSFYVEPRTITSYLAGIINQLEPTVPQIRSIRASPLVTRTLKGVKRLRSRPISRKKPLLRKHLAEMVNSLGPSQDYDDQLFLTMALVGFFSLQRLGELTQPDRIDGRDSRKLPPRYTLKIFPLYAEYLL